MHLDSLSVNCGLHLVCFLDLYPQGENLVVAHNISESYMRTYKDLEIVFVNTRDLVQRLENSNHRES